MPCRSATPANEALRVKVSTRTSGGSWIPASAGMTEMWVKHLRALSESFFESVLPLHHDARRRPGAAEDEHLLRQVRSRGFRPGIEQDAEIHLL